MTKMLSVSLSLILLFLLAFVPASPAASASDVETIERGNLRIEGIPDIPEDLSQRLQQFQNTRSASLQGWMPDGKSLLIATRFGETRQLHVVGSPGGARRQITFFDEPVGGATIGPDAERNSLLFTRDVGGSEFFQIFHFDLETGRSKMLTDGRSRYGGQNWANAADRFAYFTTQRNGRDWDIHLMNVETGESKAVLEEQGVWFPADWSPDDSRMMVARYVSANETYPYILDVSTGELTSLHEGDEKVAYGGALWAAGNAIFYISDEGSEFQRLRHRDLATGETKVLTADIDWNVEGLELSDDDKRLAFTVNEEGYSRLYLMDTDTGERLDVPDLPLGIVGGLEFSPSGQLALTLNTPTSVSDVYVLDLGKGDVTRWTYSEVGGLDLDSLVEPELIRYPTFDEVDGQPRTIPAFVYQPPGDGPFPVVVDIHGGPEGQERPSFNSGTQFLAAEMGVAVITPNVRGSSGYGKSYLQLDNGFLREDSVKDIGALLDWIAAQPQLDEKRVAVYGGSYGGYMVLASMVHYNDRLRAGVDIVGISNFVTFLNNTQDYRRDLRRVEYGDEREPKMHEFLQKISPNNHADKITSPLFVIQGQNDPRVPASESEQMVDVIRENGGDVWYLLAMDEGHGFRKKSNRDYMMESAALFLQTHLLGGD